MSEILCALLVFVNGDAMHELRSRLKSLGWCGNNT